MGPTDSVEYFGEARTTTLLTKCGLEPVGSVLADAIPAVQVERTDAARDARGVR